MTKRVTAARPRRARILLVDDHALVRYGLASLFGNEPDLEVCGEAADPPTALALAKDLRPDLAVIDLSLQNGHGLDLIRDLRARDERVKLLVVSMHDEALYAERAVRAGAQGYVNKAEAPEKVVEAARTVLAGRVYLSTAMTERLLRERVGPEDPGAGRPLVQRLSDRELMVFELIGRGVPTREIAQRLHLSVKTVETYRENIKAKLRLKNSPELTRDAARWVQSQERFGGRPRPAPPPA